MFVLVLFLASLLPDFEAFGIYDRPHHRPTIWIESVNVLQRHKGEWHVYEITSFVFIQHGKHLQFCTRRQRRDGVEHDYPGGARYYWWEGKMSSDW